MFLAAHVRVTKSSTDGQCSSTIADIIFSLVITALLLFPMTFGSAAEPDSPDGEAAEERRFEYLQIRMGIPFQLTLYATDEATANRGADRVYERLRQLDRILSDYDPDSEVNQFCRAAGSGKSVTISRELMFVLKTARERSLQTDGAFDVTIGPVVSLWRKSRRSRALPDAESLSRALRLVDYRQIHLNERAGTARLDRAGIKLDFGGIAKGYAGDESLKILEREGITRALIAGSGDIVAGDPPPGREGWRIGIASLNDPEGKPTRYVELCRAAISTSGDTYQFVEIDGVRYSHIVDPRTGIGLTTRRSVTVIAPDGITADSLATACCILDTKQGMRLLDQFDETDGLFAERIGDELQTSSSECFSRWEWNSEDE